MIAVVILLIIGIIWIAVKAGNDEEAPVYSEDEVVSIKENSDYRYNIYGDGTVGILNYIGTNSIITVPEKINGSPVTRIEDSAFEATGLTGIVLPETLLTVGNRAFYGCEKLTSLTIPNNVKTIGKDAFLIEKNNASSFVPWVYSRNTDFVIVGDGILIAYIGNAPKDLVIPNNVKHISRFYFNGPAIESVTLPEKLRSIGDSAFEDFTHIESISLPESVTSISHRAFYNCKSLTEISLPASCKTLGNEAFACCPKIKKANLGKVESIGDKAFAYCLRLSSVTLPDKGLTTIGNEAFTDCSQLKNISIPDCVTTLGFRALYATAWMNDQKNKTFIVTDNGMLVGYNGAGGQVTVEDSSIGVIVDAFREREDITGVILGNSITKISNDAFQNCTSLQAVVASKYLKYVGERAFSGCTALKQVDLLDGVTEIGKNAFEGCTSLTKITLPGKLKTISEECFVGCDALIEITLPTALQTVETNAFHQCPLEKINYSGTAKQKKKIVIEEGNAVFVSIFNP